MDKKQNIYIYTYRNPNGDDCGSNKYRVQLHKYWM